MELIKKWIADNNLKVVWQDEKIFFLNEKKYLCLPSINGRILDDDFNLIKSEENIVEALLNEKPCDYYCFCFGGKVYHVPTVDPPKSLLNPLKYIGKALDKSGFTYLGIHGGYELCNGSRDYNDWCSKAKFLGIDSLGICDRQTLAGTLKFQQACQAAGIKPIIGETFIVKRNDKDRYQIKVYCKSKEGWQSLLYLNCLVNVFNEEKCLQQNDLDNLPGIIVVLGEVQLDDELCEYYALNFDENIYYQLDPVEFSSGERDKKKLEAFKSYLDRYSNVIPPVLICDSFYLDKDEFFIKRTLNKIAGITPDYSSEDQYFKPLEDVIEQLDVMFTTLNQDKKDELFANSLTNLDKIISSVDFTIETGKLKLPKYVLTEQDKSKFSTVEDVMWDLLMKGFEEKIVVKGKDVDHYMERLEREMQVITKGGFIDYFLILAELNNWCKLQGILTGMGRGSAAGSLVAYVLDLTRLDPIPLDLLFERFLDESRLTESAPDIDSDFPASRRDEVKRYLESRYGEENVCSIGTYGTFKGKSALRDFCRLEGVPPQTINYHAAMIEDNGYDVSPKEEYNFLFRDALQSPALKRFLNDNSKVVSDIELVIGQAKNTSVHPSGVIITPSQNGETIFSWMPVKKVDGVLISEWEGTELEAAGFLKEDILGIKQLDKFQDIFNLIELHGSKRPDYEDIDYNDQNVLELFRRGWNEDLFHFGSQGLTAYCKYVRPDSVDELIAIIALFRPGVIKFGTHEDYVKIKHGKKELKYDWGCEEITKPTYSLLVYQEQVMRICQVVGGLSMLDANKVRKGMSKQILAKILPFKEKFIKGAAAKGCSIPEATKIWNKMEAFATYSFNKSHAAAYARTGYFCQYLKYYYPMEYWTVSLQYAKEEDLPGRIAEIRKLSEMLGHIKILPPDINKSEKIFTSDFEKKIIYWSLGKVKFVGEAAVNHIIEERNKGGQFFSIEDFYSRIVKRSVNKRAVINLILTGCFDQVHNVEMVQQRKKIIEEFYKLADEDMPAEYNNNDEFFWFSKQREVSGSGYFDYYKLIQLSLINNAQAKYLTPDRILLPDNVDCDAVVVGVLLEIILKKSKKGEFAQLIMDHNSEKVEVTVWSDSWEKYADLLTQSENKALIISGKCVFDRYRKYQIIHTTDQTQIEVF